MGIKSIISLEEINLLFPEYNFTSLAETTSGIIDTTYIVFADEKSYILKKYEREISEKIQEDIKLLDALRATGLRVPRCFEEKRGWYLYERLEGEHPLHVKSFHIQALARFMAKFHKLSAKKSSLWDMMDRQEIRANLDVCKRSFYSYYKRLEFLATLTCKDDGIIHGDIFKDNVLFENHNIGVFDFIDSANGSFAFDIGVALVGFGVKKRVLYTNLFLQTYNQRAPKKVTRSELAEAMRAASAFYALKRIANTKKTKSAQEILR